MVQCYNNKPRSLDLGPRRVGRLVPHRPGRRQRQRHRLRRPVAPRHAHGVGRRRHVKAIRGAVPPGRLQGRGVVGRRPGGRGRRRILAPRRAISRLHIQGGRGRRGPEDAGRRRAAVDRLVGAIGVRNRVVCAVYASVGCVVRGAVVRRGRRRGRRGGRRGGGVGGAVCGGKGVGWLF